MSTRRQPRWIRWLVKKPLLKLGPGHHARLRTPEPSVSVVRHEAVQRVAKPARQHAEYAEHRPRERHAARDGKCGIGTLECSTALDDHDRARRVEGGQFVTHLRARSARRLGLQRREPASRVRIARDHEPHHSAAEVADAVEEDDDGLRGDGRCPCGWCLRGRASEGRGPHWCLDRSRRGRPNQ